ncbi:minor histocompatibility protein HA-1-like protein [Leptotrombidium deliense]|uniref:Minor histocompatibility protein HA-1-like protein n=1 Tax=Leptotrombidium deliense TaxID=299467 RepID=A0A443SIM8_9ACAR|nr:minor histocompatibility protein HA-1-like protein [Leptotrombidium deliense]
MFANREALKSTFQRRVTREMNKLRVDSAQTREEQIPAIVVKCVSAIEKQGKSVKGIYRISGVKSSVEKLCQSFENEADFVDLCNVPPNVIANVLKLYLRQLPEPLLTFRLYTDFIRVAKKYPTSRYSENISVKDEKQIIDDLKEVVNKLPRINYKTLEYLMHHLNRVSTSAAHNMPPSNLGIVFGPNLLRTNEDNCALRSLVDTVYQTRVVELLITYANETCDQRPVINRREAFRIDVRERLAEVLKILRIILTKYSAVQSTELLIAAGNLIKLVKTYNYENEKADRNVLVAAIDRLAVAFTFGTELESQGEEVPKIVVKCIEEVEKHGQTIQGLYRVSGVKSKVEKLCQSFQNGADSVDLSDVHPIVISSVLKLFLRQLPEPLLTFRLYSEFIRVAKKYPLLRHESANVKRDDKQLLDDLNSVVLKLPPIHLKTLAYLMHHLKRISKSPENNMPATNLGIVFGPTLLRTKEDDSALSSLMDTVHQTRIVELLITFAREVFGPSPYGVDDSEDDVQPEQTPLVRAGKHVDFSSMRETTTSHSYSTPCVINSAVQQVVTSTTTKTPTKQIIYELRRQFFTTPYSPPRFNSLPVSMPIASSVITSNTNNKLIVTQHNKLKRTSSSSQLQSHVNNLVAQELRPSTSSQTIRLIDDEDDS